VYTQAKYIDQVTTKRITGDNELKTETKEGSNPYIYQSYQ